MAKLDALLRKYRERTACDPIEPVELKVLARLRGREAASVGAIAARPAFRPAAIAGGFFMGLVAVGFAPLATTATASVPELAVFAPDAPNLPSTWLGQTKK